MNRQLIERYAAGADVPAQSVEGLSRQDLLAFLRSLTDEELLRDPRFSNPW